MKEQENKPKIPKKLRELDLAPEAKEIIIGNLTDWLAFTEYLKRIITKAQPKPDEATAEQKINFVMLRGIQKWIKEYLTER